MTDITLRQLRYFTALVRAKQYQRAALALGISQPSLSLQIAALEEAVGAKLVERRRAGLVLTPIGREVATRAVQILQEVDGLTTLTGLAQDALSGTLRLGTSPTVGPYLLPRVLRQLHGDYPDLRLVIRDAPPRMLTDDLVSGQHDMILTHLPVAAGDVAVQPLFREPLHLAVPVDHPLAGADRVGRADLAGQSVLSLPPTFALHGQVAGLAATANAHLREDLEGTSLDALRQMVSLGMGVTVLPALYVRSEVDRAHPDVVVRPLHPAMYRQVGLAWRTGSGHGAAFARFCAVIRTVLARDFAGVVQVMG